MLTIADPAPDFVLPGVHQGKVREYSLREARGNWLVLFFYPADFTFVCPTELGDLADNYKRFVAEGAEILVASTDTAFSHKAWHDSSPTIGKIEFPMLADPTGRLSRDFGVYIEEEGLTHRGTFLIDPNGILMAYEIHEDAIGRSTDELLRKLQAAKFVAEHHGEVCPMNWKPGSKTLKRGVELVGKI